MDVINIRSDTQTLPTDAMLQAMATAPLGDDTYDEDPTVQKLEAMAAERLGMEAAMLVISGNMANLCALMSHARPGDEVLLDPESHIYFYESGGLASVAGLMPMSVPSERGMMQPDDLRAAVRKRNIHHPTPRLFCLENTHNRSGGRVVPLKLHQELCAAARENGLAIHLDGARIFNAAIAADVPVTDYTRDVDSIMFCLSKGLSCPLGSVLCGRRDFIEQAQWVRKRLGGGMRQAGVIAAAGIVALEQMVDRLAEDHEHARLLARALAEIPGLNVDLGSVETNMVNVDHSETGLSTGDFLERLKSVGILAGGRPPRQIRFVANRHHTRETMREIARRVEIVVRSALQRG
ncbi:MAG: aminotransferase class I/II-fold pyridoxal phosphate-dependent enzyme [Planctomycetaceae bacterium]|nr:aminotransferase class I/II-fold pyridoxal phosphate-dependent enzyme [Planctomycetaceae bacterium]